MTRNAKTGILGLAGLLALGVGLLASQWLFPSPPAPPPDIAGIYLPAPQPLEDFQLVHHGGQPFTRENLRGHWTFLYFGYSFCPDVCPITLFELNRVRQLLDGQGVAAETAYVFVSVDPQRDTPERLRDYVTYFNPEFQGVTGAPEELERLTRALHVFYQRGADTQESGYYLVDHSSTIILIDPDGRPRAIFTPPQTPERLAADFLKIRAVALP
jgi:protein SCO1/2